MAGSPPYRGTTAVDVITGHLHGQLPPLSARNPAVSPAFDAVLGKALARDPVARFATGAELADAFDAAVAVAGTAPLPPADRSARTLVGPRPAILSETQAGDRPRYAGPETRFGPRLSGAAAPDVVAPPRPASGPLPAAPSRTTITPPPAAASNAQSGATPGAATSVPVATAYATPVSPPARRARMTLWAALTGVILLLMIAAGVVLYALLSAPATQTPTRVAVSAATVSAPAPLPSTAAPPTPVPTNVGAAPAASATAFAASDPALSRVLAADALLREGRFTDAIDAYKAVLATNPDSALANRQLGHALWIWNHEAGEIDYLDRATTLAPRDPLAWAYLSYSAVDTHQSERAYAAAQEAVRLDPTLAEGFAAVANTLIRYNPDPAHPEAGNQRARAAIEQARTLNPDNIWVLWFDSAVRQALEEPDAALVSIDRALAARPNWPTFYYGKGTVLSSLERPADARAAHERALALDPDYPFANTELGWLTYNDGDYEGSHRYFTKALSVTDIDTSAHDGLGYVLIEQGDYVNAERNFQRSIGIEPRDALAYAGLGNTYLRQRRYGEALAAYRKTIDLRPLAPDGYIGVARVEGEQRHFPQAEQALDDGLGKVKHPAYLHFWRGWLYRQQERFADAQPPLEEAARLEPRDAGLHYWLGVNLESLGRPGEARRAYERALELRPDYPEAHQALDTLASKGH